MTELSDSNVLIATSESFPHIFQVEGVPQELSEKMTSFSAYKQKEEFPSSSS